MRNFSVRLITPLTVGAVLFAVSPLPAGNAAVGALLSQVPQGEITCATAEAYWTNDADYQNKVAQAQALAAFDDRGNQILAALAQVDAAAESCGLKGTVGDASTTSGAEVSGGNEAQPAEDELTAEGEAPEPSVEVSGAGGTPDAPITDAAAVLGPVSSTTSTPMKTIEVLGQGQVEVPDAEAMLKNYLRQLTIIV